MLDKNVLVKHNIISDVFDYSFLDDELIKTYHFFENRFSELYKSKTEIFDIKDYFFYIKSGYGFNAFANRIKGYNIIGITAGYVIHTSQVFNDKHCKYIFLGGLKSEIELSDSFAELEERTDFKFSDYMLNCSIEFTFGHEFQHILQFNSDSFKSSFLFSENSDNTDFSLQKHAWEFDADRFGIFNVLKYAFETFHSLNIKKREILKCLIFSGVSSIIITRLLFYFNIIQKESNLEIEEFYTKKYSHPHPFIRIFNIIEYSVDCSKDLFPDLNIEIQDILNHSLNISNIFLNSYTTNKNLVKIFFEMIDIDSINLYNNELYSYAISDNTIKNLLIKRNINFK